MDGPPLHDALAALAPLVGTWSGRGRGEYPTIDPFEYLETVTFGHVGKPFLSYRQATQHPGNGEPMHAESGWLRAVGGQSVELTIAQPTGIVEVHVGHWRSSGALTVSFASRTVATTPTAVEVQEVRRTLTLAGDELRYDLAMAAVGHPLTHHLAATLHRTP